MAWPKLPEKLEPYRGILLFVVVLFISNALWKYNITGDEDADIHSCVTLWGMDITAPFTAMAIHVAHMCKILLTLFGRDVVLTDQNILGYANGNAVRVIWACTGLKQAFITFCIFLFSRGELRKKIWYIPLTLFVGYIFNIIRISAIVAFIETHPEWFEVLHMYIFKYLFYGIIFLMWVWWEEKIAPPTVIKPDNRIGIRSRDITSLWK